MDLNATAGPYVAAVNPPLLVNLQISTGSVPGPGGTRTPAYATPGSLQGSVSGSVLTVTSVAAGKLLPGQTLADAGNLVPETAILSQLTGTPGGVGTYQLDTPQEVSAEAMTTSQMVEAQVQALTFRDITMVEGLNLQGDRLAIYFNGRVEGLVRPDRRGGDLVTMPDGSVWLVAMVLEGWSRSANWTKVAVTLQNGS